MNLNLINVAEAKKIIEEKTQTLQPVLTALKDSVGKTLATDVYAPVNIPAFTQSGMDGYALSFSSGNTLPITGEQAAGAKTFATLEPGKAVRIFTGAVVPEGADTVVMQEKTKVVNGFLHIESEIKLGDNVRLPGTEIEKDALALSAGTTLTPASIGFLAGMGIAEVAIIPSPRISIIVTGNELQAPGTVPEFGKVYESNSFGLIAALQQLHIKDITVYQSEDDVDTLTKTLQTALDSSDMVLMTGGVSVGDYDFTVKVSENCGMQKIFHKIKQKPGKPIFFGTKETILFFGLPGNPASVLTCFYEYVIVALEKLTARSLQLKTITVPLNASYKKTADLTHFLKGIYDGEKVDLPQGQESYKLNSFAKANCLVVIPETTTEVQTNENIEIHLLP